MSFCHVSVCLLNVSLFCHQAGVLHLGPPPPLHDTISGGIDSPVPKKQVWTPVQLQMPRQLQQLGGV